MSPKIVVSVLLLTVLGMACGGAPEPTPQPPVADATAAATPASSQPGLVLADAALPPGDSGPVPVTDDDPTRGSPTAPVTIVMFGDLECPFSAKAAKTLEQLEQRYGATRLRIAFKHFPLAFHKSAQAMHEEAATAFAAGGNASFWAYFRQIYIESERADGWDLNRERALGAASLASPDYERRSGQMAAGAAEKVAADVELGRSVGVKGTPAFLINGVFLSGAQPLERFAEVIDAELAAHERAKAPASAWYALRTAENRKSAPQAAESKPATPPPPDLNVYRVPIGKAPVRGPADALVTVVGFVDFECPFSAKVQATLTELLKRYPRDVRVVFKHRPLPFHKKAEPAHQLAQEIFVKKGADAFWKAHDDLFANVRNLDEATLTRVAKEAGLAPAGALAAVKAKKHKATIVDDEMLAEELEATGTPSFFINGRRLVGSMPLEKFVELVDDRMKVAREIETGGVLRAKVYDEIMKTATTGTPLPTKAPPAIGGDVPVRGPKNAPVTIQVFADLECRFCKRLFEESLPALEKEFPGKLRVAWRNLPLPMHKNARAAAASAMQVRKLKGDAAFWKMVAHVFAHQQDLPSGGADSAAKLAGVAPDKLRGGQGATDAEKLIEEDVALAKGLEIRATPTVLVNGYLVNGASEAKLRRAIRRAVADAAGKRP